MKPKSENPRTEQMLIRLTKQEKTEIEKLAKKLEMPQSTLARNLLLASAEDIIILEKIGIVSGYKKYKDFKEAYGNIFRPGLDLYKNI